jgi:chaperonin GroES
MDAGAGGAPVDGAPQDQQWLIPPGAKRARGDRVSRHMSYQLTEEMEDWEEQTDKMLHIIPIVGCAFRKVWFDPHLDRNRSEVVQAKDLVVNYSARSLETAPRITHEGPAQALYPYEIVERERMGLWLHIEMGPAASEDGKHQADDEDAPHQFLEQHRYLDLDDDGYQEPYIVTVHKETRRVVRIVARYDAESILQNDKGEVAKIDADHYFIKYPFIPSPDGAFYDVGFGTLLNPINESVNTTLNQMLDAGHLQNTGGGFIGKGLRLKSGPVRFRPGEWKPVDVQGGNVKENVVPLPFPGASQTLFQLLGLLIEAGRDITSVKDVMTGGEGPKNEAASRTLARIEQGMKVFTAIYKRLYRAWKKELKLLFLLNSRYLNPETYFTFQDDPEAIGPEDYNSEDMDIVPVADPAVITDMQRMARGEFLMQFLDDAYFDPREMRERILASVSVDDIDRLLIKGEPPPDPSLLAEVDKIDIEKKKLELERSRLDLEADKVLMEITKMESEVILNLAKAEGEEEGPQMAEYKNMADVIRERVKAESAERMATQKAQQVKPAPAGA